MIVLLLLIIVTVVFVFGLLKRNKKYISLNEVIPAGEVVSVEEGIVEYKGVHYVLGTNDLERKRNLLQKLDLLNIDEKLIIDLSYDGQVIIRAEEAHEGLRRK